MKRVRDLSPRDIEHDNPEFRRVDEMVHFLAQIYGRKVSMDDTVTVVASRRSSKTRPSSERMPPLGAARNYEDLGAGSPRTPGARVPAPRRR